MMLPVEKMDSESPIKILFLSADPTDASRLRLGQELRDIRERLQLAKQRDRFILESRESVRPGDISQAIFDVEPQIVHFSGHAKNTGELCFENISGEVQPIQPDALAALFELVADRVNCVVLNACYSEIQAEGIAKHIPFVVGMSRAIEDQAAITFAVGFYKALGANRSIEQAYKYGCVEIQLQGITGHLTPVLHKKKHKLIDDLFYVERPPIEKICYKEISRPGSLIRIKAPHQMGKTWLITSILAQAARQGYRTVYLSFQLADKAVFTDLDQFLRWFCVNVTEQLELPNRLADYWKKFRSSNQNCSRYFDKYLLAQIDSPLVLGLDEVERLFEYPEIYPDFLSLLRVLHEKRRHGYIWKRLRLIVAHSTEIFNLRGINSSPFNVGLPIELPEFNQEQVQDLAQRYELDWAATDTEKLMTMVGGHPYLVHQALARMSHKDITLEHLLQAAPTEAGIYSDHLRQHLLGLQEYPELAAAFSKVVTATEAVQLDVTSRYQIHSMGLVKLEENQVIPRCNLYRYYFQNYY